MWRLLSNCHCLQNHHLTTAVVQLLISRSFPSNGCINHYIYQCCPRATGSLRSQTVRSSIPNVDLLPYHVISSPRLLNIFDFPLYNTPIPCLLPLITPVCLPESLLNVVASFYALLVLSFSFLNIITYISFLTSLYMYPDDLARTSIAWMLIQWANLVLCSATAYLRYILYTCFNQSTCLPYMHLPCLQGVLYTLRLLYL